MDNILLAYSDTLEKVFDEMTRILPCWRIKIAPEKAQREDSINYLRYKIRLEKI